MLKLAALNAIAGGATSVSQADIRLNLNPEYQHVPGLGKEGMLRREESL